MEPRNGDSFKYFRIEASELIDQLTRGCLALEKGDCGGNVIEELNRAAHSLKGAARLVELFPAGDAAHTLEDAFAELLKDDSKPARDQVTALLRQVDELQQMIADSLECSEGEEGATCTLESLATEEEPLDAKQRCQASGSNPESIHELEGLPPSSEPVSTPSAAGFGGEVSGTIVTGDDITRVSTDTLNDIGRCAGRVLELGHQMSTRLPMLQKMRRSILSVANMLDKARHAAQWGLEPGTTETSADRRGGRRLLDTAFLRIDTSELRACADGVLRELDHSLEAIGPLGDQLHRLTLDARMVSISDVAHRFEKTVRDTASQTVCDARFELLGGDVRIDRTVLQGLTEPICHLLRNAVTHGIETPSRRRERGKPIQRQVRLSFERSSTALKIVVEDDGDGLDAEPIRRAAGAAAASLGNVSSQAKVSELIFRPGVTTRTHLSKVAGRGIGLDVVHHAVQKLRGVVKVDFARHRFCRFTIDVPCSLDVMDVFILGVGGQDLLVPMKSLVRTCVVPSGDIHSYAGAEAILVDDRPVRLLPLSSLVGIPSSSTDDGRYSVAVLDAGGDLFAVAVDALKGKQRAVIKNAGPQLQSSSVLDGAVVMSDGRPGFLLDTVVLADLATNGRGSVRGTAKPKTVLRRTVLVVDDSLTTRMLEKALLESADYRVLLARDGDEALTLLTHSSCDLIIVDFEMPGMNGLELTSGIREIPGLADVPIIMLTSRGSDEDKRQGLAAGLRAYLVKGQFDQSEFLATVRGLIGEAWEQE